MDFRRIPFQFTSTDPVKRQAELQKRFGLSDIKKDKMHLDFANSGLMGMGPEERSSASSSPRLQHRVPVFVEGAPEMMSSVDSQGSPNACRKPRVRVVPIEIEGDDSTKRHRNLSGSKAKEQLHQNGSSWLPEEFAPYVKPPVVDPKPAAPRERSIPVKVEGVQTKKAKTVSPPKPKTTNIKQAGPKQNGCAASKVDKPVSEPKNLLSALSLKKIETVLEKLKTYHADVEKFSGTVKDKQYRYLDEMLIRLMLELDNIDTMGNEEVRLARKAAVKKVQASVDLLEAKVAREQVPNEDTKPTEDVEMELPSSQEDSSEPGVPDEDSKTAVGVVNELDKKVEDVEMDNSVPCQQKVEVPVQTNIAIDSGDLQTMEVDDAIDSEPVITTVDSPVNGHLNTSEINADVTIEELKTDETNNGKELCQEPVVTFEDSPVKEIKTGNEINNVHGVPQRGSGEQALSDASETTEEAVTKASPEVTCEGAFTVEHDFVTEHSELTVSNHSPDISSKDALVS